MARATPSECTRLADSPAPTASPLMAAMTGFGIVAIAVTMAL
ncbi:MAG TPA: hypothetical protein VIQ30_24520 [Pseudonocardia sp.]